MPKLIAVCGATGNQGGSVARCLFAHTDAYTVRALTRNPDSERAKELALLGAEVVKADLRIPAEVDSALDQCWGVFGVTDFYDTKIQDDPASEEPQGRNLADAALANNVQCFIWSTLPSSRTLSAGRFVTRLYEGKHNVDTYIRDLRLPATFFLTGNFYENLVLRKHIRWAVDGKSLEYHHPIVKEDAVLAMLWVEKDLAAATKAVLDQWEVCKIDLHHREIVIAGIRITPGDIKRLVERRTGMECKYIVVETCGVADRDIMFEMYNDIGMYPGRDIPDPILAKLGVQFHGMEQYIEERLLPSLGF